MKIRIFENRINLTHVKKSLRKLKDETERMLAPGALPPRGVAGGLSSKKTMDLEAPQLPRDRATPIPVSNPIGLT